MKDLPASIVFIIWQFAGPNAIYLNKDVTDYGGIYKQRFRNEPLAVYYQLQRLKERVSAQRAHTYSSGLLRQPRRIHRSSIYVESPREILLNGSIPLGRLLKDGTVKYSRELKDQIIPTSVLKYCSFTSDSYKVTYWEVEKVWVEDISKSKYVSIFIRPMLIFFGTFLYIQRS